MFTILTENDQSNWNDKTGILYHFPSRYLTRMSEGRHVLYYKGRMIDKAFADKRLSQDPHYFGIASINKIYKDVNSAKNDYYAELKGYQSFSKPILAKIDDQYLEPIPESKKNNYWREAVREISKDVYDKIVSLSGLEASDYLNNETELISYLEGKKGKQLVNVYHRNKTLRDKAVQYHGTNCYACDFNFAKTYGDKGEDFVHVHHKALISKAGEGRITVAELVVLCANCHAMVHRKRDTGMSAEELREIVHVRRELNKIDDELDPSNLKSKSIDYR